MDNHQLLSHDVKSEYISCRKLGLGREAAVQKLLEAYSEELQDPDDAPAVIEGIVCALRIKRELSHKIAEQLQGCLSSLPYGRTKKAEQLMAAQESYGAEAVYRRKIPYDPEWKVGDLFAHKISTPKAVPLGIHGWMILFYKVGEYEDKQGTRVQLVYTSICPPGQEPATAQQLEALGFVRMMDHGNKWDYLAQIEAKSKRYLSSFGLVKIGNLANVRPPVDRTEENPVVSMPLFGMLRKTDDYPSFEDLVCLSVKNYRGVGGSD